MTDNLKFCENCRQHKLELTDFTWDEKKNRYVDKYKCENCGNETEINLDDLAETVAEETEDIGSFFKTIGESLNDGGEEMERNFSDEILDEMIEKQKNKELTVAQIVEKLGTTKNIYAHHKRMRIAGKDQKGKKTEKKSKPVKKEVKPVEEESFIEKEAKKTWAGTVEAETKSENKIVFPFGSIMIDEGYILQVEFVEGSIVLSISEADEE